MVAGTYLMSAFMSAHSSLLFTLHQLQQQQLMQCLPATILLSLSLSLSLSLLPVVPHSPPTSFPCSPLQQATGAAYHFLPLFLSCFHL